MRIVNDVVLPFADQLRFETATPPRAAVLALFTLMPTPLHVLSNATSESSGQGGRSSWTLLALELGGMAIVRADAIPGESGTVLSARWHPTSHLRCVGVTDVETQREVLDTGDYAGKLTWLVRIEGEGELLLPVAEESREAARVEDFCRRLQAIRGASRDEPTRRE